MTLASVFQSSVFISLLKSWSILVGLAPSNRTRTLSFFFNLFGAFEAAGKKIVHDQGGDERGHAKVLLWIVVQDMQIELIAAFGQTGQQFVDAVFFFVSPLANRIHEAPPAQA